MQQWTPTELAEHLQQQHKKMLILDVREPWEYEIAHIDGSVLIPLGWLAAKHHTLDKTQTVVVVCHHGIRSAHACYYLEREGFQAINLIGGIDRWARDIDHAMPVY